MAVVRFGVFELDEQARELRRNGRLVHLTGQPMLALQLLVSRPGEIVTREELRRHLWPDGRFVDFERSLNACIASLRRALDDSARSPRWIETVPRRGHRFIGEIRTAAPAVPPAPRPSPATRQGARRWRRWLTIAAVLPVCVSLGPPPERAHTRRTAAPAALAAFEAGAAEAARGIDGRRRSIYRFREAARLDPRFAEAHFALADVYLELAKLRALPVGPALAQARESALRAIALEEVPNTRTVLGAVRLLGEWDWSGARRELERSLAEEPRSDATLMAYARLLSAAGEDERAIEAIDRAEALSPACDLVLWESALVRYRARRWDEALDKARLALAYGPPGGFDEDAWRTKIAWLSVLVHADQGAWTAAARDATALEGFTAGADPRSAVRAFARRAAEASDAWPPDARRPMWTATLYALAGDADRSLASIERAARTRDPDFVFALRNPAFAPLRSDPRFGAAAVAAAQAARRS